MRTYPLRFASAFFCAGVAERVIGSGRETIDFSESIDCFGPAIEAEEPRGGILALSTPGVEGGAEDSSSDDASRSSRISSSGTSTPVACSVASESE